MMVIDVRVRVTKDEYNILSAIADKYNVNINTIIKSCLYGLIDRYKVQHDEN